MPLADIVPRIKPAIVGLGLLADEADPLSVVIRGTGFLIDRQGWIMTNRHVAELFVVERDGQVGVRNAIARAVFFVDAAGRRHPQMERPFVGGAGLVPFPIVEIVAPPGERERAIRYDAPPDLAVCRVNPQGFDRLEIQMPNPLRLGNSDTVRDGEEIGIIGFPQGLDLRIEATLRQMTPIVQRGVIAAVLPFSGVRNPHAFQLDMNITGGSSGSPVFRTESDEVLGVVFAARVEPHPVRLPGPQGDVEIATIPIPTGLGYAVPINRFREQPRPPVILPDIQHGPLD